jgi:hypothetical protein
MRAAWRRCRPGTGQMDSQEIDHARLAQIALNDPHHNGVAPDPLTTPTTSAAAGRPVIGAGIEHLDARCAEMGWQLARTD